MENYLRVVEIRGKLMHICLPLASEREVVLVYDYVWQRSASGQESLVA